MNLQLDQTKEYIDDAFAVSTLVLRTYVLVLDVKSIVVNRCVHWCACLPVCVRHIPLLDTPQRAMIHAPMTSPPCDQGDLGEVLIRCNNVLYIRKAEE
jgi:small nuclear ribonucleoprotein (snRNP)-like protein